MWRMNKSCFFGFVFMAACIWVLSAAGAFSNSISSISVEPTFECAGIIVNLSGTDDPGVVTLEVKGPTESTYKLAHPFLRYDNQHMASSLFDLTPGTTYSIRVTLGGTATTSTVTTRTEFVVPNALTTVNVSTTGHKNGTAANPIVIRGDISAAERAKSIDQRTGLPVLMLTGAIDINSSSNIVLDSLRFENAALGGSIVHIYAPSTYCVIQDCQMILVSNLSAYHHPIYLTGDYSSAPLSRMLIQGNYLCDTGKGTGYSIRVDDYSGTGNVIRRNIIIGPRDGISPIGGETFTDTCTETYPNVLADWPNQSTDVYENTIYTTDDNIEIDGVGVNCRVFRNNLMGGDLARLGNYGRSSSNISISPVMPGPFYIYRNVMTNTTNGAVKFNTGCLQPQRNAYFYHNTIYDLNPRSGSLFRIIYDGDSAPNSSHSKNMFFKNNVMRSDIKLVERDTPDHVVTFNPNYWYSTKASGSLFDWDTVLYVTTAYSSFDAFKAGTGLEAGGYWGDPMIDPVTFHLNLGSPAIDKGIIITGINDGYIGSAPDMGAFEYGTGSTTTTTGTGSDVFANLKVYPNPFRLGSNISIKIIGLPVDTVMNIYGADGGLIKTLSEVDFGNYGWLTWDGKNTDGKDVAFGVYVCVADDGKGNKKTGKIAVLK